MRCLSLGLVVKMGEACLLCITICTLHSLMEGKFCPNGCLRKQAPHIICAVEWLSVTTLYVACKRGKMQEKCINDEL